MGEKSENFEPENTTFLYIYTYLLIYSCIYIYEYTHVRLLSNIRLRKYFAIVYAVDVKLLREINLQRHNAFPDQIGGFGSDDAIRLALCLQETVNEGTNFALIIFCSILNDEYMTHKHTMSI